MTISKFLFRSEILCFVRKKLYFCKFTKCNFTKKILELKKLQNKTEILEKSLKNLENKTDESDKMTFNLAKMLNLTNQTAMTLQKSIETLKTDLTSEIINAKTEMTNNLALKIDNLRNELVNKMSREFLSKSWAFGAWNKRKIRSSYPSSYMSCHECISSHF